MSEPSFNPGLVAATTSPAGGDTPRADAPRHATQEFEAIILARVLGTMRQGLGGDDLAGDGRGQLFRDLLNEEVRQAAQPERRRRRCAVCEVLKAQEVA